MVACRFAVARIDPLTSRSRDQLSIPGVPRLVAVKPPGRRGAAMDRAVPRLRRSDCAAPGIARRRRGRGFEYRDPAGERIDDPEALERISQLAIPPAWREVWICMDSLGHLQATGIDAAGRKQYLYHPRWRSASRPPEVRLDDRLRRVASAPAPPARQGSRRPAHHCEPPPPRRPHPPRSSPASACSPARYGCSILASSGSAPRTTPSATSPTASPRCSNATSRSPTRR